MRSENLISNEIEYENIFQSDLAATPTPVVRVEIPQASGAGKGGHGWFGQMGMIIRTWLERSRQRYALGALDDRMLSDIGVSRAEAGREAEKWFWQI